jgi:hypothetical protein
MKIMLPRDPIIGMINEKLRLRRRAHEMEVMLELWCIREMKHKIIRKSKHEE